MELELDLANILKGIAFCEISIENMRIKLAENPNFDINFIFPDKRSSNVLTSKNLIDFLSIYRIAVSPREAEYIINLNSGIPNVMDFESLYKTILPKTDTNLYNSVLNKAKIEKSRTYNQHFSSEITLRSVSEREVAKIFEEELNFYRSIEKVKKDFRQNHSITLRELFKLIDYRSKGYLDFESLENFMTRLKVLFSKDEFWALLRRIAVNLDNKLEYQELVFAIFPNEPYEYPAFREKFHSENALEKAKEFGFVEPNELRNFDKRKKPLTFLGSGREKNTLKFINDPLTQERKNFIYDQSYHLEYHNYKAKFIEPSKNLKYQHKKSNLGIRGMDDFFGDYYMYLSDRENSEEVFNKYGKRYTYVNALDDTQKKTMEYEDKTLVDTFRYTLNNFKLYDH